MHIVVCIKQVPDSAQIRVHPVTNTIMRQGVPTIVNPYDLYSLETALRLKDQHGGKVTVLTMGPPMAADALRKALSFGADRAVLLTDRAFAGSDTLATSYALATAIKKIASEQPVDMVFCGKQTIDGDTAQVGPGIASRLELHQLTYISKVVSLDRGQREITVERRGEGGVQVLRTKLPVMVTMLEGSAEIRFASMNDMLRAARSEIEQWSAAEAGIEDLGKCGLRGSPTVVKKVFAPKASATPARIISNTGTTQDDLAKHVVELLFENHPKLGQEMLDRAAAFG